MKLTTITGCLHLLYAVNMSGGVRHKELKRRESVYEKAGEKTDRETEKLVYNIAAYKQAKALVMRLRGLPVKTGGVPSEFGNSFYFAESAKSIEAIESLENEVNEQIKDFYLLYPPSQYGIRVRSTLRVYKINSDDKQIISDISGRIKSSLDELRAAMTGADYKTIRKALTNVRGVADLLDGEKSDKLKGLVTEMRKRATAIKAATEESETALIEVKKDLTKAPIDQAESALLDVNGSLTSSFMQSSSLTGAELIVTDSPEAEKPLASVPVIDTAEFDMNYGEAE